MNKEEAKSLVNRQIREYQSRVGTLSQYAKQYPELYITNKKVLDMWHEERQKILVAERAGYLETILEQEYTI